MILSSKKLSRFFYARKNLCVGTVYLSRAVRGMILSFSAHFIYFCFGRVVNPLLPGFSIVLKVFSLLLLFSASSLALHRLMKLSSLSLSACIYALYLHLCIRAIGLSLCLSMLISMWCICWLHTYLRMTSTHFHTHSYS